MKITIKSVYDIETGQLISWDGYDYEGPVELACSSGGDVAAQDKTLQDANTAANTTFLQDANTAFAGQQAIQAKQTALANNMIANPFGYTPKELAIQTTGVNENFSRAAKQAIGASAAYAAQHGAADVGGGGAGQIAAEIGTAAATGKAGALSDIASRNEAMKRESMLTGLSELNTAGAAAGGAAGTAIGGAGTTAKAGVEAGTGVDEAQKQAWSNFGSILGTAGSAVSTIAGL